MGIASPRVFVVALFVGLLNIATAAQATINGFGDFSGFTINQFDNGSPPTVPTPGSIELTNGFDEDRSIFANVRQDISQFSASFTYQTQIRKFSGNTGATFALQNDPAGLSAGGPSYLFDGFAKSVGITFDLFYNTTGLFTDGNVGSGAANVAPVDLGLGNPINVQLTYTGSTLAENLVDTVTGASFTKVYLILTPFATTVGSPLAFVGFSAGGPDSNVQTFSNLHFTNVPEPSSLILLIFGVSALVGARLIRSRKHRRGVR